MNNLQILPRISDSLSYLYVDQAKIERDDSSLTLTDHRGKISIPIASLNTLIIGPGTNITQAALILLAESGCSLIASGEGLAKFYTYGQGDTHSSENLMQQATLWANTETRKQVVLNMYHYRFQQHLDPTLTLEQIRGMEGVRVRNIYKKLSEETGVPWKGRDYKTTDWSYSDTINRAISCANVCLYGICHAAIVSLGLSTGLGFVHTGRTKAFVYDIADLYKMETTIPLAFNLVKESEQSIENRVRKACRQNFLESKLITKIVPDILDLLNIKKKKINLLTKDDHLQTLKLWDDKAGDIEGGKNFAPPENATDYEKWIYYE